jgi:hypothetical protein
MSSASQRTVIIMNQVFTARKRALDFSHGMNSGKCACERSRKSGGAFISEFYFFYTKTAR